MSLSFFFFSLSFSLSLSADYVVSPPISLEKGNECAREEKPCGRGFEEARWSTSTSNRTPSRFSSSMDACSPSMFVREWWCARVETAILNPLGFGKEEIKSEEGSADFRTREILQFCPSDSSSLRTFDRSFFCPDARDGDVKLTICRACLFLIEQHQIHQVSLLGHLQLGH